MKLKNIYLIAGLLICGLVLTWFSAVAATLPMVDDFEGITTLPLGKDTNNNSVGFVTFGGENPTITLTTVTTGAALARPGQGASNQILKIDYNVTSFGGFTHAFENATNNGWVSQNWKSYTGVSFWLYGANTGKKIQFEIFDNRAVGSTNDTAERWINLVDDNFTGWKKFEVPFMAFTRGTGYQPTGAPNDGLTLTEVWGYAINLPGGTGAKTNYLDDVMLYTAPATTPDSWQLQWSDEFTGTANTAPSGTNWLYDLGHNYPGGAPNWGTGEIEEMTNSLDNVYLDGNGNLAIKPIRTGDKWTSGRIETQRTDFEPPANGKMAIEGRIQIPNVTGAEAKGYWPAFWTLGAPFRGVYTNWPKVGEIDILENVNGENTVYATFHCGVAPGGPCNEFNGLGGNKTNISPTLQSAFHVYRMELDRSISPQEIRWYLNGELFHIVRSNQVDATTWNDATNHGFFIILNVAIGGGWPGMPTASTVSGKPMLVDYVRVYYSTSASTPMPQPPTPTPAPATATPVPTTPASSGKVDDFEKPLPKGKDSNGNDIGITTWGDSANTTVTQTMVSSTDPLARPGQGPTNQILKIDYEIGSYGGFTHAFENAAMNQWVTQNWTSYKGFSFWLYGANTGKQIQVEIFDNRSPDAPNSAVDSAERYFYRIDDNYTGWKQFDIPFTDFKRRTDWQPTGAPDDGLGLKEVHGYAFSFPAGTGKKTNYLDEVTLSGGTSTGGSNLTIDDFEANIRDGKDTNGNNVGVVTWGDSANTTVTQTTVSSTDPMARPGQGANNRILKVDYEIGSYGGFTHAFENAAANQWVTQDWTSYKGFSFWFYGANTAKEVQVEIFDNRGAGSTTDSAERYYYRIMDNFTGWKHFELPFADFKRRTDWQPTGAPEDGLGLKEVHGYAFSFPAGTGKKTSYIDDVMVYGSQSTSTGTTIIDDFNEGISPEITNWGSADKPTLVQTDPPSPLPGQTTSTKVLSVTYNVAASGWGGFTHAFAKSQDWSSYEGFSFWFYGMNTGTKDLRVEIKDGGPGVTGEGNAEIFAYYFNDDFSGWKQFKLPWSAMPRRTDYNPGPTDGLSLKEMWGYAIGTDGGAVNKTGSYYLEDVALYGKSGGGGPTPTPTPAPKIAVNMGKAIYRVNEGSSVAISVTINTTATEDISVDYMSAVQARNSLDTRAYDDQAKAGVDYKAVTGTISFKAGDAAGTTKTFMVETLADTSAEVAENFKVMLVNPVKVNLGEASVTTVLINAQGLPYLDPKLSTAERVKDLLGRMSIKEKVGQMTQIQHQSLESKPMVIADYYLGSLLSGGGGAPKSGNTPLDWANMYDRYQEYALSTRLQIPMIYGIDAVHGNNNLYGTTIFPHNIGLGATRNPALAEKVARVTALEIVPTGIDWTFAPCLCVARDERWGRTYESFGEDPEIASMMTSMVYGYQGATLNDPDSVLASAKHYVGDGGTMDGVNEGNAIMDEATLRSVHISPFTDAIKHKVGTIMPSYSSWNGLKMHAHKYLLQDVLKDQMGFKGFLISDWAAIDQIPGDYNSDTRTSINAGLDMVMVPGDYVKFTDALLKEIVDGNVPMSRIDDAVSRILTIKFEMGLFERPFSDRKHMDKIGSKEHRDVARQAVRESLVLLKNDGKILPLAKTGKILVAGKNADDLGHQLGGWSITWQGNSGKTTIGTTILEGIKQVAPNATVTFNKEATGTLTGDIGIVVVGERPYAEGAGDARTAEKLSLDAADKAAINNVCSAMPCVVVLISGRPLLINDELAKSKAFVAAWLPGTEGAGVADVLFGDAPFTGKLPMTWPKSFDQLPINKGDGKEGLFAYGYGMTYQSDTAVPTTGVTDMKLGQRGVLFTAPANTFNVAVTLRYTDHSPIDVGTWRHVGVFYTIEAVDASGKVVAPTGKYTIKVPYSVAGLPSSIDESQLALYYRDASGKWVKESSSVVDKTNHIITATPNHFSEWAILAADTTNVHKVNLPVIMK